MTERQQMIVCAFDQRSLRVSAFDIHEWIHETLHLQEHEILMVQIVGLRRHVYINLREPQRMQAILTATQGKRIFDTKTGKSQKGESRLSDWECDE